MTPTAKALLLLLLLALALSPQARAADNPDLSAQALYDLCNNNDQHAQDVCQSWIYGFAWGMVTSQIATSAANLSPGTCIPEGVTGGQALLIIEKFMRDHPELLHHNAAVFSGFALTQAFPCKR
jgi:hypothetical protein